MAKNNFTYVVGLEGGVEEGPLTLAQLQPMLRERKVVGSTFIKRSDRGEWTTASDLPELKVRDVVELKGPARQSTAGEEIEKELCLRKVRSGVTWLFWIAALSLLNSGLAVLGIGRSYAMGLGAAHLIAALGDYFGNSAIWVSLAANVTLSLAYLIVGVMAWHGRPKLLGPVIAIYVADAVLCGFFELWLSVGIHAWALFCLVPGLIASYTARGIQLNSRIWATHLATATVLSVAGFAAFSFLEKAAIAVPAPWAASAPAQWPQISVANSAEFKGHTELDAGNAFFIRLKSGKVVAATAKHLLGPDGGVEPALKLSDLNSAIKEWNLTSRGATPTSARVRGLHGSPDNYLLVNDMVLLQVASEDIAKLPAEALTPRFTPVVKGEPVFLVGTGAAGTTQEIHPAKVTVAEGWSINAKLEKPIDLVGFSGAPIIDAHGNLLGILTSSRAIPDKQGKLASFIAESVLEVRNLLR